MSRTRLKVCCISSVEEARIAIAAGADAIGLVSAMPSGPGVIDAPTIAKVAAAVPPPIATFLLTSHLDPDDICRQVEVFRPTAIQIVDTLEPGALQEIRRRAGQVKIVQVIHVLGRESVDEAMSVCPHVDALLLDSGNPTLETKELGGTGRVHDWGVSAEIVQRSNRPVFLAGGLNFGNVKEAINQVSPFGIDVCTGVRSNGKLDPVKLGALVAAIGSPGSRLGGA